MAAYSFLDVSASIAGPGGLLSLGSGSGAAEEGIKITMNDERGKLVIGADGTPMHSLSANKSGKVTVTLLKTSPTNARLSAMFDAQSMSAALWGQNVITVSNSAGDVTTCRSAAFVKKADNTYAEAPGTNEWEFNCGVIDGVLGEY